MEKGRRSGLEKDFETGLSLLQDIHQAACVLWLGRRGLGCRGRARQGDRRLVALPQGHPESTGQLELESAASKKVDEPEKNLKKTAESRDRLQHNKSQAESKAIALSSTYLQLAQRCEN
jgi:hypothetical protein